MANQAIALQARAPQTNFMGAAIQRNAQMINQMTQQRAAERQSAVAQQQMELARAKEARDVTASQVELAKNVAANFRDQLNMLPPNDVAGAQALRQQVVETIPGWDKILPSAEQIAMDPQTRQRLLMKADEIVKYSYATPVASTTMDEAGNAFSTVAGGLPGVAGAFPMQQYALDPNATVAPPPSPTAAPTPPRLSQPAPVAPEALDAAAQAIAGGKGVNDPALRNLPPAALDEAQKRAMRLRLDTMPPVEGAMQPMSAQQGQPDLAQVVNDMMATGFVTQSNLEAMRQVAGPDKDAQLAEILRSNNIQILPDEGAEQFRSAVYRPEEGAATLQRGAPDATLEEAQYVPTGRQFKGKSPMQSPVPGSAIVPLPRVREEKAAETSGSEETKFDIELRKALPQAKGALNLAIKGLDRDISDIDFVLTNPAREMVVGSIEGRLPSIVNIFRGEAGQQAQDVQSRLDKIKASSIVKHLQEMRAASPQGSSLFGQVTEYEDRLVAALAGLDQAQSERQFDLALRKYRDVLVEMRQNIPQVFNDTYGKVGGKAAVSGPTPAPGEAPRRADVDYLLKNKNNPKIVAKFRQHFGEQNLQRALKGR